MYDLIGIDVTLIACLQSVGSSEVIGKRSDHSYDPHTVPQPH